MDDRIYRIRYTVQFITDMSDTARYITHVLKNPQAAYKLTNDVEKAILERSDNPDGYEPYRSMKKRPHTYYRIYVRNHVIYYVIIDDIMEVRRFIYGPRDVDRML